ncbi:MAG TPA: 1-acyl-sn-glycerol-3-phosphate acyltransferase [Egicoccus sp.]|nr:1-acyl-sn-glycerol-3-phosphate acyltransferase [Egicoccus sp.]HSK23865.1 1-acyl-sn-glycerol-3-phosphate acyltransferase [Egicoccus sp.]
MQTGHGEHPEPGGDGAVVALLAAVREIMADVGRGPPARIVDLDARLDVDLGLDSLSVAELLVRTEELFGVSLPEQTLATARTLRDLLPPATMADEPLARGVEGAGADLAGSGSRDVNDRPAFGPPSARPRRTDGRLRRAAEDLHGVWALGVFGVMAAVVGPLIVLVPTLRLRWRLVRLTARLLPLLVGVRVRIEGARHLPRDRPFVMVANHASHVDPLLLVRLLEKPAVFAALAGLADNPVLRLGLRRMHTHLVGRGDRVRGVADVQALTDTVRAGHAVVFFPEGRRAPAPGLEPFRMGAFLVAARSGVPVVPVAIRGTRAVLPVGRTLPRRATVTVTVAPPVTTRTAGWHGAVELQREARRLLLRHSHEPDLA